MRPALRSSFGYLLLGVMLSPPAARASGFALIEQSGSGLGNAYSGAAAAAEDASTIYFNPAGMSRLQGKQLAIAGHYIRPSTRFQDAASVGATLFGAPSTNSGSGDAAVPALVPNGYFTMEISPNTRFGVGINVPFGLATEYPSDWIGRFQGIRSELATLNINPALSWTFGDNVALGVGLNYQTIDAELTSKTNYAAAVFSATGSAAAAAAVAAAGQAEGTSTLKGDDSAWGWNAGMMFAFNPDTRIGVAYRSRIQYSLEGTATFHNRPAALAAGLPDGNIKLDIKMPDNLSFAFSHALSERWQILADATWTGWKVLNKLEVIRTDNIPASGATLQRIPYNWRNTWRLGIGTNYRMNDAWTLKAGFAYDQTPTNNTDRGVRLPDGDRTWISVGAKYQVSKAGTLDFGLAHLFVRRSPINNNAGGVSQNSNAAYALVNGQYDLSVDIVSLQYTHRF